jgi:hypothetical protein
MTKKYSWQGEINTIVFVETDEVLSADAVLKLLIKKVNEELKTGETEMRQIQCYERGEDGGYIRRCK